MFSTHNEFHFDCFLVLVIITRKQIVFYAVGCLRIYYLYPEKFDLQRLNLISRPLLCMFQLESVIFFLLYLLIFQFCKYLHKLYNSRKQKRRQMKKNSFLIMCCCINAKRLKYIYEHINKYSVARTFHQNGNTKKSYT